MQAWPRGWLGGSAWQAPGPSGGESGSRPGACLVHKPPGAHPLCRGGCGVDRDARPCCWGSGPFKRHGFSGSHSEKGRDLPARPRIHRDAFFSSAQGQRVQILESGWASVAFVPWQCRPNPPRGRTWGTLVGDPGEGSRGLIGNGSVPCFGWRIHTRAGSFQSRKRTLKS